jgi:serine/threonine protein kinase
MEVFDAILDFLNARKLTHVSELLKAALYDQSPEAVNSNKEKRILGLIKKSLGNKENQVTDSEAQADEVMQRLITRLIAVPDVASRADKQVDSLVQLRAFQKIVTSVDQIQSNPPVVSSKAHENPWLEDEPNLPHFGAGAVVTEAAALPSKRQEVPADDDELFMASRPTEDRQEASTIMIRSNASFGAISIDDDIPDEYEDNDDPGFEVYECAEEDIEEVSRQLAAKHNLPSSHTSSHKPNESHLKLDDSEMDLNSSKPILPRRVKFPDSKDPFYPVEHDGVTFDCYSLKVIYDREKTGFEESKDFQIVINNVIAGRYQVMEFLGSAAFSKAIQCLDLLTKQLVCLKIIENNKDYFDQSIDEIKLLKYIDCNADVDQHYVLKVLDCFYHKEHLFIVTELLRDNLYEFSRYNRENEEEPYFTVGRLQRVAFQVLKGLEYIHSLHLIHSDLKPENVLIKSYSRCEVKVIDFGSSCFIHDHLSSYVQSRSYRAPEVILGCKYDYRIDIWSLGCILAELWTGHVLFQNETIQGLLARVIGIIGPFTEEMMTSGRHVKAYFTPDRLLYQASADEAKDKDNEHLSEEMAELIRHKRRNKYQILVPKRSSLKARLKTEDSMFLDFLKCLLQVDKDRRPTSQEALRHPWMTECKYIDGLA